jgi:carbonic anhydrase
VTVDEGYRRLLANNEAWVKARLEERADYFTRHVPRQRPEYLWIGCSDSRVPAETVTGCEPGELFVHRNIANLVVHTDLNMLSVLHYAIEVLEVKHVIVCGHHGCGGVEAALSRRDFGLVNRWLARVKDVYERHQASLGAIPDPRLRMRRMVELVAVQQIRELRTVAFVQKTWRERGRPWLHAWTYDIETGRLAELEVLRPADLPDDIYRFVP